MAIPGYQKFMFPILKYLSDGVSRHRHVICEEMVKVFHFSEDEMEERVPSQRVPLYINRIGWALTYLKKAGLLETPSRAQYKITAEGLEIVRNNIVDLDTKYLKRYESFLAFQSNRNQATGGNNIEDVNSDMEESEQSPMEKLQGYYELIKRNICDELLSKILEYSPYVFEKLVVDLIVAMGYGGNIEDAGQATQKSCDEGIDGLIKEDRLGLEAIYIQAKRYEKDKKISRPAIQQFMGSLMTKGARKGIFITTSDFTKEAIEATKRNTSITIVLINGEKLVDYMYEFGVGVTTEKKLEIKRVDNDYFDTL